jgi:hypothetical protein
MSLVVFSYKYAQAAGTSLSARRDRFPSFYYDYDKMRIVLKLLILLLLLCTACTPAGPVQPMSSVTAPPETATVQVTDTPTQDSTYTECGYAWATQPLADLSQTFDEALKEAIPQSSGRAEAYGENCLNSQGEVVRFLTMETDFHITIQVQGLEDKQTLGTLTEQVLTVIGRFPVDETPGPQPGYVGIIFAASGDDLRLWFTQTDAETALENGLHGEELFNALQ